MTIYMLDTNIASYALKRRSRSVAERMDEIGNGSIVMSVMSYAEIHYGLQNLEPGHWLNARVDEFMKLFPSISWSIDAAIIYSQERRRLERLGSPLEVFDLMIAAHAISIGATLVTNNIRHFERIGASLQLQNWHQE